MPKYEYQFQDGTVIVKEQRISEEVYTALRHPETERLEPVTRLIGGGCGIHFRGKGWTPKGK